MFIKTTSGWCRFSLKSIFSATITASLQFEKAGSKLDTLSPRDRKCIHFLKVVSLVGLNSRTDFNNYVLFSGSRSQCIYQMKELKEQCEERIEEIAKKANEIPQDKQEKEKNDQVRAKFYFMLSEYWD